MTINLKMPEAVGELKPRITVFGVGGAGGNAVNNMIQAGLEGVEFVVANTDAQALAMSSADQRIQMGTAITEGLGAGSQPQIGAAAAEEAMADILDHIDNAHMVFITAGMGGGTGTGAAPVIARLAREQGILTIGVVTKPFQFEGVRRMEIAERGIEELAKHVDTLIVIPNQNLFRVANERTTFADAFAMADQVLYSGVAGITDLMVKEGLINLDFADVRTIMFGMGKAMMGTGEACGEKRAIEAAEAAIANPLLDDVSMKGARGLLISITGGEDLTLYEVDEAATRIRQEVDNEANIILGATFDTALEGYIRVSVVATGIDIPDHAMLPVHDASRVEVRAREAVAIEDHGEPLRDVEAPHMKQSEPERPLETAYGDDQDYDDYRDVSEAPEPRREEVRARQPRADEVTVRKIDTRDNLARRSVEQPRAPVESEAPMVDPNRPFIPPKPAESGMRMPRVDDFPQVGQRAYHARNEEPAHHGVEAQKRKTGFLERLASVGLGRRGPDIEPGEMAEPRFDESGDAYAHERGYRETPPPPMRPAGPAPQQHQQAMPVDRIDDDELEIPAFLRRQAN